jgi:hypothetical protein
MATKCAFNQLRGEIIPSSHQVPLYSKKKKRNWWSQGAIPIKDNKIIIGGYQVSLLSIKMRKKLNGH